MSNHETLRGACASSGNENMDKFRPDTIAVSRTDVAALLAAFDALNATKPRAKKLATKTPELPEWLPLDAWNAFLDMRKKIKKPATEYAQKLLLKKLAAFYVNDCDPSVVLNQSIMNGWQDLYEPKDQQGVARGIDSTNGRPVRAGRPQQIESDQQREDRRRRWGLDGLSGDTNA